MSDESENESGPDVDVEAVLQELRDKQESGDADKQLRGIDDVSKMGITFMLPNDPTSEKQAELLEEIYETAAKSPNMFYENNTQTEGRES